MASLPVESPRLRLRRFETGDAPTLHAYRSDPATARYQTWGERSRSEIERFVADQAVAPLFAPNAWSQIALEVKADRVHVGDLAVRTDGGGQAEIGFTLAPGARGRGYAVEAVGRLLEVLFSDLSLHRVTALTDARNAPAIRVLGRLGFRKEAYFVQSYLDETPEGSVWVDECAFALLAHEWPRLPDRPPNKGSEAP